MVDFAEIRIYFEGDKSLKPGFDRFLKEIRQRGLERHRRVELIATGGKPDRDFTIAIRKHPVAWNVLLRDSEGPYRPDLARSRCTTQGWESSRADSIFWMVEMMEAWFHADKDVLETFYKRGFRKEALKPNPNVEEITKQDLMKGLKAATKDTAKGAYHKTKHAPALLELIDPALVRKAAPNCEKLFSTILSRLG